MEKLMEELTEEKNASLPKEPAGKGSPQVISFLFALFYTFCLYRNTGGITYPFFAAGGLLLLFFYLKKYGRTAAKGNGYIAGSMLFLAILQCTTASPVILFTNRVLIWILSLILLIRSMWPDRIADFELYNWLHGLVTLAFRSIYQGFFIFGDSVKYLRSRRLSKDSAAAEKNRRLVKAVFWGVLITVPLLFVILLLLSGADVLFRNLLQNIFDWKLPNFLTGETFWGILFMIAGSCLCLYGLGRELLRIQKTDAAATDAEKQQKYYDTLTGLIISGSVSLVYLLFSFIQIFALFLRKLSLPENYTYAEYAREGFFQLAALCALNILLVLLMLKWFQPKLLLKIFLLILSGCTYIMIASAAYKMILYVKTFRLSFLRLTVLWSLLVMTILMTGVVYYTLSQKRFLVRFFFITLLTAYCIFVAFRPDYRIAKYNLAKSSVSSETRDYRYVDSWYLTYKLSADAVPAWIDSLDTLGDSQFPSSMEYRLQQLRDEKNSLNFRTFNFSRYRAGILAEKELQKMQTN